MKYRWHSLRLVILVLQKSLAYSSQTNRDKNRKREETKRKVKAINKRKILPLLLETNEEKRSIHRCHSQHSYLPHLHKRYKKEKERKPKLEERRKPKTLDLALWLWTLFSVALQGVFIGAEGGRVPTQLSHENGYLDLTGLPRKRGLGRVSAALWWRLATRFGAWPPLVRPSGLLLLEAAS